MEKTKVLHVTFDMAIAGTEQVIRQLVENTDPNRFECSIMCIDGKIGELGQLLADKGFKLHTLARNPSGLDFNIVKQLKNFVKKNDIDVLHCHQYTPYIYGLFASFGTKTKVIFTEHGRFYPDTYKWKRMILNPFLSFFTASITTISKATAEALITYENFPRRKIEVIYNGIHFEPEKFSKETDLRNELKINTDAKILGTISRLDPIKNQTMMIEAFYDVLQKHPNTYLLIVGDGPERPKLERLTKTLNIQNKVIFTGFKTNPQRYFNIIDVFLLSSLSEGTSMTLLEAMAFEKPSVVTNVGGNPEIIEHEETGLVSPNKDKNAFGTAISRLLTSPKLRQELSRKGKKSYFENYTSNIMASSYEAIYERLALQKNKP